MQINEINYAIKHLSMHDNTLSTIIKNIGIINLRRHRQLFKALLRAIIGQQLSISAAEKITGRLMKFYKNRPEPKQILATDDLVLRSFGLSNAKIKYVKNLSLKISSGELNLKNLSKKSDCDIIYELVKVKGIGIWTVHMFLIFTLGRLNVLPYSDLGIRKAVMLDYSLRKLPGEQKIKSLAKKFNWHPYCSVASIYLWKSLDSNFESIIN